MLKIIYMHKELKALDWNVKQFNRLVLNGDLRGPEAYKLVIRLFGFINITLYK